MVSGLVMSYRLESMTDPNKELDRMPRRADRRREGAAEAPVAENIRLQQEYIPPLATQADGRAMVQPIIGTDDEQQEYCIWPTDKGFLNFGIADSQADERFFIKFTMHTRQPIEARLAYIPPDGKVPGEAGTIVAGSRDGFVYAIAEKTGETVLRYSAGEAIVRSPVVIDDRVYVCTQLGGMHCLDAKTGKDLWWAADIMRIPRRRQASRLCRRSLRTAVGVERRQWAARRHDPHGRLLGLARQRAQRPDLRRRSAGLVQCLHEIELSEPLAYNVRRGPPMPPPPFNSKAWRARPRSRPVVRSPAAARRNRRRSPPAENRRKAGRRSRPVQIAVLAYRVAAVCSWRTSRSA